jgi:hypothetical protein
MMETDRQTGAIAEAGPPSELPSLPSEPQLILLGGLFALAVLTAA